MFQVEQETDLCLVLGTSLSGMNSDRIARTPAQKMLQKKAIGTVIINLQQTPLDAQCAIRVWAKLDDAFRLLAKEFDITEEILRTLPMNGYEPPKECKDVFTVPYDADGVLSDKYTMKWDLRPNAKVKIAVPFASNAGATGEVVGKVRGHYSMELNEKRGTVRRLQGNWWVDAALRGAVPRLPVVNLHPVVSKKKLQDMTIEQLRKELRSHGINSRQFFEKSEMIIALNALRKNPEDMPVSELKQELEEHDINTAQFYEKSEMVQALKQAREKSDI
jgi:predicted HTH domain antitoxin